MPSDKFIQQLFYSTGRVTDDYQILNDSPDLFGCIRSDGVETVGQLCEPQTRIGVSNLFYQATDETSWIVIEYHYVFKIKLNIEIYFKRCQTYFS